MKRTVSVVVNWAADSPDWWEAARHDAVMPAAVAPLVAGRVEVARVDAGSAKQIAAWARKLPGWHGRRGRSHPLIFVRE